ncbi:S1C family serine protease [Mycobacterium sp. pV006]|uniref:S1C family serine protease n=1 Tax=Mycobacterium sp. pV006 TaxID=3238983 RepID=UPI00351B8E78
MDTLRRLKLGFSVFSVLLLTAALVQPSTGAIPRETREKVIPATVKVYALDNDLVPIGTGSGSILVQSGQILTNHHVVANEAGELANADGIVLISITTDPRDPPNPTYLGKVIRSDAALDLALVTVVSDISGRDLTGCLTLPTHSIGDSDGLLVGDEVAVIGFPSLGGNSVTYTEGTVSGFEKSGPWIKTDTEINPGNSGGSAIDGEGKLVGVPTQIMTSGDASLQGKIGFIRPIAAGTEITKDVGSLGVPGCKGGSSLGPVPSTGAYGPLDVAFLGYTATADATEAVETVPSGSTELFAHFGYYAVPANTPFAFEWLRDGQPTGVREEHDEWPVEAGDGMLTVSTTNAKGLADGRYSVRITAGNGNGTTPEIRVGGTAAASAKVSVRGSVVSADTGRPISEAYFVVLAPGITWADADLDNPDHILDVTQTNARGAYQSSVAFPTDQVYSVGVVAEGYENSLYDGVDFTKLEPAGGGFVDAGVVELKAL